MGAAARASMYANLPDAEANTVAPVVERKTGMAMILDFLAADQAQYDNLDVVVVIDRITERGIIESTADGVLSLRRYLGRGDQRTPEYADVPRHYSIAAVTAAYFTEGS